MRSTSCAPDLKATVLMKNRVLMLLMVAILVPVSLVGLQESKRCSEFLHGLYYGSWDNQGSRLAFVISSDGRPIPPKSNDPDAPTAPGFYEGQQRFDFVSSRFSPRGFTFRTVAVDGRTFSFSGRFGCEAVDAIPEVPFLEGELTEMRNGQVVRKKRTHFGHAVVL
jgi:hypothetical protein